MFSHFQGPIHFYKSSGAKKSCCSDAKKRVLIFSKKQKAGIILSPEGIFIAITTWANEQVGLQHVLEQWFSIIFCHSPPRRPPWIEIAYYWEPANIYLFRLIKLAEITSATT